MYHVGLLSALANSWTLLCVSQTFIHQASTLLYFCWRWYMCPLRRDRTLEKTETVLSSTHSSGIQKALYLMQLCIHFFSFCSEQRTSSLWCAVGGWFVWFLFESSDFHQSSLLLKMSPSLSLPLYTSPQFRRNKTFTFLENSFIFSYFLGRLKLQKDGGKLTVIKELSQRSVKIFTQAVSCPNWQLEDIWLSFIMHYPCHLATQRERGLAVSMSINAVRVCVCEWVSELSTGQSKCASTGGGSWTHNNYPPTGNLKLAKNTHTLKHKHLSTNSKCWLLEMGKSMAQYSFFFRDFYSALMAVVSVLVMQLFFIEVKVAKMISEHTWGRK